MLTLTAVPLANAFLAGGVDCMELILRTPAAMDDLKRIRAEIEALMGGDASGRVKR